MKVGTSFKRAKLDEQFDVIIIGSGMGGMTCGSLLAKAGKKVCLLEKHYVAGGFTHVFKRKDYEWDVGIHYVGEVNRDFTFLSRLFQYLTNGKLKWAEMDEVYDQIIIGEKRYDFVKGTANFAAKMKEYFPNEGKAIDTYIHHVYMAAQSAKSYFAERALPPFWGNIAGLWMRRSYTKYAKLTTLDFLNTLTTNKELIGVLTGQYGDYGLTPSDSSFAIHAMVAKHYFNGAAYPVGGSEQIAQTISPEIEQAGGQFYVNAGVEEILVENKKAVGVKMEDGRTIKAPIIISNAGVINTYANLLSEENSNQFKLESKLQKVQSSTAHICLYGGIKEDWKELGLPNTNLWIYPNSYDHDKSLKEYLADPSKPIPIIYVSFPSAKDPDWNNRYPGKSTVEIVSVAPYKWFQKWESEPWKKRGDEYDKLKEEYSMRLLNALYQHVPQLKGKIDYYELSSPLSTKQFTFYNKGEIYGIDHTPERFQLKFLRAHTPIKNLYLTGQDIVTAGIGGAALAGLITASAILKKNLIPDILKATKEHERKPGINSN